MLIYNGETVAITVVAEGNPFTVIQPGEYAELAGFTAHEFYVQEPGEWYAKREHCHSGADIEIYNAAK
ncbi:hypothetical protein [Paenibacillus polymyxa]|uniref:Uncharacterized protein n=1 Tax=Paenibacillus polymyxa (strain SC2) TaxID=886882 RepID=E3EK18_PAEPS|nr:hypothetical protein [Paenibacillus polymyxa]ADO59727.1 hypothetical protein PPSC2_26540 [Paenibacillus polymyxa SC2]WPQ60038.1 hypothetical protein SKN87_27735 [Paenibacillus polymyxa]